MDYQTVSLGMNTFPFATIEDSLKTTSFPAASITNFGKGKMAATYFTMGEEYNKQPNESLRQFLLDMVNQLFPNPIVRVEGSHEVDVTLMQKDNKLLINLINTSGAHRTEPIVENIKPINSLNVKIRQAKRPQSITFEPSGKKLPFTFKNGEVKVIIPELKIHDIIVIATTK
jgi:hypothetical protein